MRIFGENTNDTIKKNIKWGLAKLVTFACVDKKKGGTFLKNPTYTRGILVNQRNFETILNHGQNILKPHYLGDSLYHQPGRESLHSADLRAK